jgi:hypothetical protein
MMANNKSSISAQAAPSWRDVLPVHPAAEIAPINGARAIMAARP